MRAGLAPSSFRPPGPYFCLCFHPAPLYLAEQQEIERAIEEVGYELSRLSVRTDDFPRG
jgi:hypothetical protein